MLFEACKSILYADTLVPDIFVSEYMPSMDGDYVKIYLHCLFLSKNNKQASVEDLSKKLGIDAAKVKDAFTYFESVGIANRSDNNLLIADLKEKEINKMYRPKTTSTPEEAALSAERNKKRNCIITAISNTFFQGLMGPSWYTDIDAWFDRYKFDEDVMYALFQHCASHKGLAKQYIGKVAEAWYNKGIKTYFDLENYLEEYQKYKDIKVKIGKKLKLSRNFTEYEEEYIEKWVMNYNYDFDVIEMSLKKTAGKTNPSIRYIDAILTSWNEKGLKCKEEVDKHEKSQKYVSASKEAGKDKVALQRNNYKQREYDDEYFNSLYENTKNG